MEERKGKRYCSLQLTPKKRLRTDAASVETSSKKGKYRSRSRLRSRTPDNRRDSQDVYTEHSQHLDEGNHVRAKNNSDEAGDSSLDNKIQKENLSEGSCRRKKHPMKARRLFGVRNSPSPRQSDTSLDLLLITDSQMSELLSPNSQGNMKVDEQTLSALKDLNALKNESHSFFNCSDDEESGVQTTSNGNIEACSGHEEPGSDSTDEEISSLQSTIAQLSSVVTKLKRKLRKQKLHMSTRTIGTQTVINMIDISKKAAENAEPSPSDIIQDNGEQTQINQINPAINASSIPKNIKTEIIETSLFSLADDNQISTTGHLEVFLQPESKSCSSKLDMGASSKDMTTTSYSAKERRMFRGLLKNITIYISKCAISGPPGTGKSHLRALLLGKVRPVLRRSTPLSCTADEVTSDADIIADSELLRAEKEQGTFKWLLMDKKTWAKFVANTIAMSETSHENSTEVLDADENQKNGFQLRKDHICSMILTQLKNMPKNMKRRKHINEIHLVYLVDTGGQPQFQEVLPNFVRASVNILVHKLSEDLYEFPEFSYFIDKKKYSIDDDRSLCNLSIIEQTVRSVCSMKQSSEETNQVVPSIAIVGTFKDHFEKKCEENELQTDKVLQQRNKEILSKLDPFVSKSKLCQILTYDRNQQITFPINGSESGWKHNVVTIDKLKNEIMQKPQIELKMPLWNFVFLQMMKCEAHKTKKNFFTMEQCIQIAEECILSPTREDIQQALRKFHDVNVILYFPESLENLVFVEPSFLYQIVTEVIVKSFHSSELDIENKNFSKTGIMKRSFLEHIPSFKNLRGNFTQEMFLKLLQDLLIIADLGDSTYFMPCVLPLEIPDSLSQDCKDELESIRKKMHANNIDGPLVISFGDRISPRGLFCSIIVELNKRYGWKLSDEGKCIRRRNIVEFSVYWSSGMSENQANASFQNTDKGLMGSTLIFDRVSYLEVYSTCSRDCCRLICRAIINCLHIACEKMKYSTIELDIQVGLYCNLKACEKFKQHHTECSYRTDRGEWFENCRARRSNAVALSETRSVWFSDPDLDKIARSQVTSKVMTIKDVLKWTIKKSHKWKKFATLLLGDEDYTKKIEMEYTKLDDRFMEVIKSWHHQIHPPFTWNFLVEVLRDPIIAEDRLAQEIEDEFIKV